MGGDIEQPADEAAAKPNASGSGLSRWLTCAELELEPAPAPTFVVVLADAAPGKWLRGEGEAEGDDRGEGEAEAADVTEAGEAAPANDEPALVAAAAAMGMVEIMWPPWRSILRGRDMMEKRCVVESADE
jgi:hypothetical protein